MKRAPRTCLMCCKCSTNFDLVSSNSLSYLDQHNVILKAAHANQNHNEVPLHASQDGCYPKVYKQSMLERVWRKGNPLTLLVGMQTSTAAMENSVEISEKTGNRTAI